MKTAILAGLTLMFIAVSHVPASGDDSAASQPSHYEMMRIKHMARKYACEVSPNRELWIYIGPEELRRLQEEGADPSAVQQLTPPVTGARTVNILVEPSALQWRQLVHGLSSTDQEIRIGAPVLDGESLLRNTTINTYLVLDGISFGDPE